MRRAGLACAVVFVAAAAAAQDTPAPTAAASAPTQPPDGPSASSWFVRAGYSPSHLLTDSPLAIGGDDARMLTLEAGRQTDGSRDWHRVYNYPSYGVGLQAGRFGHDRELGRPVAAYGFFSWPFPVARRAQITADFGLGVSWNWRPFDPATNPTNTALGSSVAYYVDGGVFVRFAATNRVGVYAGLGATHWSNGSTSQPNLGLAVVGPKLAVRYDFSAQPLRTRARPADLPVFEPSWEVVVGAAGSAKTAVAATNAPQLAAPDRRREVAAFNVTTAVQRHFYRFGKVAAGADLTYDGATGARLDIIDGQPIASRAAAADRLSLGAYGGYEHVIARFSAIAQVGYTTWRRFDDPGTARLYQRYGARYHVSDHFWTTFAVRSRKFRKADFVEFGVGYRVRRVRHANGGAVAAIVRHNTGATTTSRRSKNSTRATVRSAAGDERRAVRH